jgi:hypothetical protein
MANLVALITVHDPGAADAIVEALNQVEIASEIVRGSRREPVPAVGAARVAGAGPRSW